MKKLLAVFLTAAMVSSLTACGGSGSDESASGGGTQESANEADANAEDTSGDQEAGGEDAAQTEGDGTVYTVGICQLMQHDALDAATQGFKDEIGRAHV